MNKIIISITALLMSSFVSATTNGKILVILSGENKVTLKKGGSKEFHPTGYFLSELAVPAFALKKAGYKLVFATPGGKKATIDKASDSKQWFASNEEYNKAKQLVTSKDFSSPKNLKFVQRNLNSFSGVFFPGGHAPMEDLYKDEDVNKILLYFHHKQKPTALICHGTAALLSTRNSQRDFLYTGYKMTAFSTAEEKQQEESGNLDGYLPYYVQDELSKAGGTVVVGNPWTSHVIRDRELITAQNPQSDKEFTAMFLEALVEYKIKNL